MSMRNLSQALLRLLWLFSGDYAQPRLPPDAQERHLETTETWHEVIQFYLAEGFRITHHAAGILLKQLKEDLDGKYT